MTSPPPTAEGPRAARSSVLTVVMFVAGIVLLLPGLCTMVVAANIVATEDVVRLVTSDPYFQIVLMVWGVCLLIALAGVVLLWYAVRRIREAQS